MVVWRFIRSIVTVVRDPTVRPTAITLLLLLLGGTVFYHRVEQWSWFDAFYFCVITLATVGFGDFTPATTIGKAFTILYVFAGIGVLVAVVNATVEHGTNPRRRGALRRPAARRRSDNTPANPSAIDRSPRC